MSQSNTDANGVLKRSTILLHGSIGMPLAIIGYPLVVYLPPFYAQEVGLNMALMALVLVIARLSDVVTDPLIGTLSDRWRTRFGRRKPWLVMGVPLMLAGTVMIFMPPDGAGIGHLLLWTVLMYLGWTMVTLPYGAWGAELSNQYHQRSRVVASREGFVLIGLFLAALAPAPGVTTTWALAVPSAAAESAPSLSGSGAGGGSGGASSLGAARTASPAWALALIEPETSSTKMTSCASSNGTPKNSTPAAPSRATAGAGGGGGGASTRMVALALSARPARRGTPWQDARARPRTTRRTERRRSMVSSRRNATGEATERRD